jgi:transcriptional regulator GlxA family with amidase domain
MLEVALRTSHPEIRKSYSNLDQIFRQSVEVVNTLLKAKQGAVSGKEMAAIIGRSYRQSSAIYHRVAGETFRNARLRARLTPSVPLVRDTSTPVDEIAGLFGYRSRAKFDQSYEKVFGVTPAADRVAAVRSRTATQGVDNGVGLS